MLYGILITTFAILGTLITLSVILMRYTNQKDQRWSDYLFHQGRTISPAREISLDIEALNWQKEWRERAKRLGPRH